MPILSFNLNPTYRGLYTSGHFDGFIRSLMEANVPISFVLTDYFP